MCVKANMCVGKFKLFIPIPCHLCACCTFSKLTVPPFLPFVMSLMALVTPPGKQLQLDEDYGGFPPVGAPCHGCITIPLPPNLKSGDVSRKQKTKRLDCKHEAK